MQLIARPWSVLQAVAVLAALVVLALLLFAPRLGLFVTWYVLIPLVPVLLLAAPGIWRNLCPVAVLSQLPALSGVRPARRFPLRSRWGATIGAGILFLAIVPLRPAIFNQDALALFLFTLSVVVASIAGGLLFPGKAGWCSSVCPVLPVERLYGQLPIIDVEHAHCSACDGCMTACYDLKPVDSLRTLTRAHTRSWELVRTPLGLFGAAFPGFILGYFVLPGDASISETYLHVITWSCASILLHAVVDQTLVRNRLLVLRVAAATAAAL
jgi:nitrite reductase (NADH) large subunit